MGLTIVFVLTFASALMVTASSLPRRGRFAARALAATVALEVILRVSRVPFSAGGGLALDFSSWQYYVSDFLTFVLVLCGMVAFVMFCYQTTVWSALFCATASYVAQNVSYTASTYALRLLVAATGLDALSDPTSLPATAVLCCVTAACYWAYWRVLITRIRTFRLEGQGSRHALLVALFAVVISIAFDLAIKYFESLGTVPVAALVTLRVAHGASSAFILWMEYELLFNRRLLMEMGALERSAAERERQYELSRDRIEAINIKCHDIKHQIHSLGQDGRAIDPGALKAVARDISIYDSDVRTGNEPLDVILTEKRLLCGKEGIRLTCIADGAALGAMAACDIYSFFGNALDNAIRAVRQVDDPEKRSISLVVRAAFGMASVHIENYFAGSVTFENGLPVTTSKNPSEHGFGTKSMRSVAEAYGGTLALRCEGEVFVLDAAIPLARG